MMVVSELVKGFARVEFPSSSTLSSSRPAELDSYRYSVTGAFDAKEQQASMWKQGFQATHEIGWSLNTSTI